jgi:hypothetical protein
VGEFLEFYVFHALLRILLARIFRYAAISVAFTALACEARRMFRVQEIVQIRLVFLHTALFYAFLYASFVRDTITPRQCGQQGCATARGRNGGL